MQASNQHHQDVDGKEQAKREDAKAADGAVIHDGASHDVTTATLAPALGFGNGVVHREKVSTCWVLNATKIL